MEETSRTCPIKSTKKSSHVLTEIETARTRPTLVLTRSSAHMVQLLTWCFVGFLIVGTGVHLETL